MLHCGTAAAAGAVAGVSAGVAAVVLDLSIV